MRFLANENIPLASIASLRQAGHDVAAVIEDAPGATDRQVLERAHLEDRIVITFDRDYGELIFQREVPLPSGVIYLRFEPLTPAEAGEFVLELLDVPELLLVGRFTVGQRERIRQRLLPSTT